MVILLILRFCPMPHDIFQTLQHIFETDRRLIIPIYQRSYVWNKEDQWEPLWEDVERVADQMCEDRARARRHFLGATVFVQIPSQTGSVDYREVIDGQQRLTTLQVLLKAFYDECCVQDFGNVVEKAKKCLFNDEFMVREPVDRFKLTPTLNDRDAFTLIIQAQPHDQLNDAHSLVEAYGYFRDAMREWLQSNENRAQHLYYTLTRMLTLVVIDLDSHDEAQVVFETLNARGEPLLQSDLIKNHLIHHAQKAGLNVGELHRKYWQGFESDNQFWRNYVGRGHARRLIIEQFFFNYLTLITRNEIATAKLYDRFKTHVEACGANDDPTAEMASIAIHAKHYRRLIDGIDLEPDVMELRETMNALGFVALHPFLLGLLEQLDNYPEQRNAIARDLESWLIRRTVCRLNTRGYNRFCVELVQLIPQDKENIRADELVQQIRNQLIRQDSDSFRWPRDDEFRKEWLSRKLYVELTQPRVRRILSRIEVEIRRQSRGMSENFDPHQRFTIEHMMPRSWAAHWPLLVDPAQNERELIQRRDQLLHTMGNLTLLMAPLNSSVSNSPWEARRRAISEFSTLRLNQETITEAMWSEAQILQRGEKLFNYAKDIWGLSEEYAPSSLEAGNE